mmetsp:Transcript_7720/g.15972  ORF Transcript_7720/g.15972 Transcript_7720/m.15972 type:complete len:222 (-) Transcript_7720:1341-2006(-)
MAGGIVHGKMRSRKKKKKKKRRRRTCCHRTRTHPVRNNRPRRTGTSMMATTPRLPDVDRRSLSRLLPVATACICSTMTRTMTTMTMWMTMWMTMRRTKIRIPSFPTTPRKKRKTTSCLVLPLPLLILQLLRLAAVRTASIPTMTIRQRKMPDETTKRNVPAQSPRGVDVVIVVGTAIAILSIVVLRRLDDDALRTTVRWRTEFSMTTLTTAKANRVSSKTT